MGQLRERYGNWALIAGSALGLGEAFCSLLAAQGFNLLMVDNCEKPLLKLSKALESEYNIQTKPLLIDLFEDDAVEKIMVELNNIPVQLMIYNAAFSQIKNFKNFSVTDLNHYLNVNVASPLKLVHAFSSRLIDDGLSGGILLMSSLSGLLGMQYIAPYAASKAFAWNLAESLYFELKPHNIDVMACIAGATATDAYLGTNPNYGFIKPQVQAPKTVARQALKNLHKKALFIPGFSNRLNYFILTRLLPRKMAAYFANKTMQKMYARNVGA